MLLLIISLDAAVYDSCCQNNFYSKALLYFERLPFHVVFRMLDHLFKIDR
jgi:hypothetical protein